MADLRDQLQTTLSGTYTLERELGGGGMSRVFVAHELRLQRKVVVKVLSPELAAGISAERFEREIQLAASLQQANIVPVLTAGDTNGLPFFTMPFVEGESLRQRLAKGALSITEVVSVLRDVARALAYAHERGVVHRDIKPDNVLLSGGAAVVTDFGIAKAISASRTKNDGETLTQMGTSIGTPAYMSPEQAAGDPDIDARADIYAFGCTAYELLAGKAPFTDRTPQRILAAQMAEAPRPIAELRGDTPPALAHLVMACLAKDPDARPQRATDVAQQLENVTSGSGASMPLDSRSTFTRALLIYFASLIVVGMVAKAAIIVIGLPTWVFAGAMIVMALGLIVVLLTGYQTHPRLTWRRTALGGAWALGAFTVGVTAFMVMRALGIGPAGSLIGSGKLADQAQILVTDFTATGADSASGGALAELMRSSLQSSHAVRLMPVSAVAGALQRMQLPPTSKIDFPLAQQMAQREGIKAIVTGAVTPLAGGSLVTVKLQAPSGDVLWSSQRSVSSAGEFVPAMDALARELRAKIGESLRAVHAAPPLAKVTTASIAALQKFTEGARATDVEYDNAKAIPLLEQAIAIDSTFGMAYRKLAIALNNTAIPDKDSAALAARTTDVLEKGLRYLSRLPEDEQLAYLAIYYSLGTAHRDRAKAAAAADELFRRFPEWKTIVTQVMSATILQDRREFARSESLFVEIEKVAPDEFTPWVWMSIVQLDQGKVAEAERSIQLERTRHPGGVYAAMLEANLRYHLGDFDSAAVLWRRVANLPGEPWAGPSRQALASMAASQGRIAEARKEIAAGAVAAKPGQPALPSFDEALGMARGQVILFDHREQALATIGAARRAQGPKATPSLRLVTAFAIAGALDSARAELARYDASISDTATRRIQANVRLAAVGQVSLAEGKYKDAVAQFRQSDMLPDGPANDCSICVDPPLAQAFDKAGQRDSAIAVMEHFVNTTYVYRVQQDALDLPWILRRLGELYEAKGDNANAIKYYQKFVDRWKNADPELQPRVTEIKQRLAKLRTTDKPK